MSRRAAVAVIVAVMGLAPCFVPAVAAEEVEPVTITMLLEARETYHMRFVLLRGTVRHLEEIAPYFLPTGTACYGAYRFQLVDDTGILPVSVLGICGRPIIRHPEVSEGDAILLEASVEMVSHSGRSDDGPGTVEREAHPIRLTAKTITRLGH
jgi:hypothetical protein